MKPSSRNSAPADYLAGLRSSYGLDLVSGFVVFLLALPLSVGIALASGMPASAGLLAAIVGGILGSLIGGSYLTINGPAAGLIVIVLGAVQALGGGDPVLGYRRTLAAVVVAGILQIAFGALRLGALGIGVPGSVVHGMLAGIGVIIMLKQFPLILGVTPLAKGNLALLAELPHDFTQLNPEIALIGTVGFLIIASYKSFQGRWTRYIPAPLIVVLAGVALARIFDLDSEHTITSHGLIFHEGPSLLLNLPRNLANAIVLPDFSQVFSLTSLRWSVSLALVASIESLLTAAAVDRMDPYRRTSNLDREVLTKGIVNIVCGMIGALPIIAEVVRSKANVANGAVTRWANFFHGCFILAFLALLPQLLHNIPLAALAAILISVGYALAHPSQFFHTAKIGRDHFLAFVVTFGVTVGVDLLIGVAAGIAVELVFNLVRGAKLRHLFRAHVEETHVGDELTLRVKSPLLFTNFLGFKRRLDAINGSGPLVLELSDAQVVDHSSLDHLERFRFEREQAGSKVVLVFSAEHRPVSAHPLAARRRPRAVAR